MANAIWIARDHQAPQWDQAFYLNVSWLWRRGLATSGLSGAVSAFFHTDPYHAPLFVLLITPLQAIADGVRSALVVNTAVLAATVVTGAAIATRLYGRRATVPAAVFVAT
ncbi:MAG TPA: hypothetical protein VG012_01380, partial [Acidimicrobiia bacterium]|nr:hypothetical protein [Acidimicrobiia bacterium]